jgi:hypothetical protein
MARPPWRSRSSWPLRVSLTDSMSCRNGWNSPWPAVAPRPCSRLQHPRALGGQERPGRADGAFGCPNYCSRPAGSEKWGATHVRDRWSRQGRTKSVRAGRRLLPGRLPHRGSRADTKGPTPRWPWGLEQRRYAGRSHPDQSSHPAKPSLTGGDLQPESARRRRSASARSLPPSPPTPQPARHAPRPAPPGGYPEQQDACARGDLLLDPGNRLRQSGHLLPQRLAPGLRLLGSLEQISVVGGQSRPYGTGTLPGPALPAPSRIGSAGPHRGHTTPHRAS